MVNDDDESNRMKEALDSVHGLVARLLEACKNTGTPDAALKCLLRVPTWGEVDTVWDKLSRAIARECRPPPKELVTGTVFVPNETARVLAMLAATRCGSLRRMDPDYAAWDFLQGGIGQEGAFLGQEVEYLVWRPDHTTSCQQVRAYLSQEGYVGNTAAFSAWIAWYYGLGLDPGLYLSIPKDDVCWRHPVNGRLSTLGLYYYGHDDPRNSEEDGPFGPDLCEISQDFEAPVVPHCLGYAFVGFRLPRS